MRRVEAAAVGVALECVRRGEIPSLRLGRRLLVTRAGFKHVVVDRT